MLIFAGDAIVLLLAVAAASMRLPRMPTLLPKPLAARRAAHNATVKARAVAANKAQQKQAQIDAFLARAWAQAEYEMRMERIESALNAGAETDLEEFYAQL